MAFPVPCDDQRLDFSMGTVPHGMKVSSGICINGMEVCTYDESHVISGGKYYAHISECRKRTGGRYWEDDEEMVICPFDPTHHVHHSVIQKHIYICEGYYKYCMDKQEDLPPRAVPASDVKAGVSKENANDDNDNGSDWGWDPYEENENVVVTGLTITDKLGIPQQPDTRAAATAILQEIAAEKIKEIHDKEGKSVKPASSPVIDNDEMRNVKLDYQVGLAALQKFNQNL